MSGALMQLCCRGVQTKHMQNEYSVEYLSIDFFNKRHIIARLADICIPLYLEIEMKDNIDISDFYTLINDSKINLLFSGISFCSINLKFLSKIYPIKIVKNSFIIKLPFDLLLGNIILVASCTEVSMVIDIEDSQIKKLSAIYEYIYHECNIRNEYAKSCILQQAINITSIKYITTQSISNNYYYNIKIMNLHKHKYKLGFFIESEQEISELNIFFNEKTYELKDCEIINYNLVYFSFNNLKYNDKNNLLVNPIEINNEIFITSKNHDLKFHLMIRENYKYSFGAITPFFNHIYLNENDIKHNFCIKTSKHKPNITDIYNNKYFVQNDTDPKYNNIYYFISTDVNNYLINNTLLNCSSISIVRFINCKINPDIILPTNINTVIFENYDVNFTNIFLLNCPNIFSVRYINCQIIPNMILPTNINTIIFEDCNIDFTNFSDNITTLWLLNSKEQSNLPYGLSKIKLYGNYDMDKMKIPFGCKIEYI
jgi:hypothetical protein